MNLSRYKKYIENFSYVTILELFVLLVPLITYPYLVRVLGKEVYGMVITAQVLASYFSILVDFGFNSVAAKHVAINSENKLKLNEILSIVIYIRLILWFVGLIIYSIIIYNVPLYREHIALFFCAYGMTLNELLFPRFFFQGMEKMKHITIMTMVMKILFIMLMFVFVKSPSDDYKVPLFYALGFLMSGIYSLIVIRYKFGVTFSIPDLKKSRIYLNDSLPLFATDIICTMKDKLNYFFVGTYVSMGDVVIYDLGSKLVKLISKPASVFGIILFPYFSKTRNNKKLKNMIWLIAIIALLAVLVVQMFLPFISEFFLKESVNLLPLRLYMLAPLGLSLSGYLASNFFIAYGYNKILLYSIIITTLAYIISLALFVCFGNIHSIYTFISISLISYYVEFIYRFIIFNKYNKNESRKI